MDRNSFPMEIAIALLVLAGMLYIGRYLKENTISGFDTRPHTTITAPR